MPKQSVFHKYFSISNPLCMLPSLVNRSYMIKFDTIMLRYINETETRNSEGIMNNIFIFQIGDARDEFFRINPKSASERWVSSTDISSMKLHLRAKDVLETISVSMEKYIASFSISQVFLSRYFFPHPAYIRLLKKSGIRDIVQCKCFAAWK